MTQTDRTAAKACDPLFKSSASDAEGFATGRNPIQKPCTADDAPSLALHRSATMQDSPPTFFRTIDLDDSTQVARLCSIYGCSEQELEEAVRMVGPMQISVEQWILGLSSN